MTGLKIPYVTFFNTYFPFAHECATKALLGEVKKKGPINERVDQDLVKSIAVCYTLEKVFRQFDVDRAKESGIKGFIYKVARNQTITELEKANTEVKYLAMGIETFSDDSALLKYDREDSVFKRRNEELISAMLEAIKTLSPEDQDLLYLWMDDRKSYIDRKLEALGIENTTGNRNMIAVRFNHAKSRLRKAMNGIKPDNSVVYDDLPAAFNALPKDKSATTINMMTRRQRKVAAEITKSLDYQYMAERLYDMLVK